MNPIFDVDMREATGNRADAAYFIQCWGAYSRAVDDIVDEDKYDSQHVAEAMALGCRCYSTPFYRENKSILQGAALSATVLWEQSCRWERQSELWKRQWADVFRHSDAAVVMAVALICVGWDAMMAVGEKFLVAGYVDHKERKGVPEA